MTPSPPSDGHLGAEHVSALVEGLLSPEDTATAQRHLASCRRCWSLRAALVDVRVMLTSVDIDPVPEHVAARIDAALLAEADRRGPAPPRRVGPRPARVLAGVAAAAAVLAGTGAVIMLAGPDTGDDGGAASTAVGSSELGHLVTASGTAYTSENLEAEVRALLDDEARLAAAPEAADVSGTEATTAPGEPHPEATPGAAGVPVDLDGCVEGLAGEPGVQPLAVDAGTFAGSPATVVVLPEPGDAGVADVWVVGPGCPADEDLLYHDRMAR